jgi:hypothetical protein
MAVVGMMFLLGAALAIGIYFGGELTLLFLTS